MAKYVERVPAKIVEVKASDLRREPSGTLEYGNYVIVEEIDNQRKQHMFHNRSVNAVRECLRQVGQEGFITWIKTESYNLPFFSKE